MIRQAIFSTLSYHSLFNYPLSLEEIHRFLITDRPVSRNTLQRKLENLVRENKIVFQNGFYALRNRQPTVLRSRRAITSQPKFLIARRAARIIAAIPWVKLVAITGALAMENADVNDDIDLMIVTAKNRLWLVRPIGLIIAGLFFKVRRSNLSNLSNLTNSLCLNLWLDESALAISPSQRNLYSAHELAQMKPIVNKNMTYERMVVENGWGKRFLANFWSDFHEPLTSISLIRQIGPISLINTIAFRLQLAYMKSKMTTERVNLHSAFFHPGNRSQEILTRYNQLLVKHKNG